ncbi:U4/U6-U5 snRNP complex subunit SPP381 CYBJADRAFT_169540 [Cyberlindnera jadinii NRRL Y-1542]|uniref:Micro-fibrillar-associated protein 1 C-terminal domain-containing protein n=1 Tax=Cyberlindnera jadinii (strain ATCC 18201 / CBS 1600 / BCRC 20928 / JCM 3617 / NBRC 0987 / NRRL Y-1542) TaxID=983966 RepID=A0A1E4RVQ2_CYBJN|nr:hypothetical protein CYBJADRAFT_169540 [Cyberlindnera jadinii NRRL Y-1542]ODV71320.1 hypothetical protein CYBJADRAFT_169540 [Cyberlindnera jadinii NRRL Y-1542]
MKRHFSGKPVAGDHSSSESSDSEEEEEEQQQQLRGHVVEETNVEPLGDEMSGGRSKVSEETTGEVPEEEDGSDSSDGEDETASDSASDSDDSSDSDSSSSPRLLKPVFLSKKQRLQTRTRTDKPTAKEITLKSIQVQRQQEQEYLRKLELDSSNYGGLDDTDGLDPEAEKAAWEARQLARETRDIEREEEEMKQLEEMENRKLLTEEERELEARLDAERKQTSNVKAKGAFYRDESILSRKMEGEVEKYDKSLLPQRYKPKK